MPLFLAAALTWIAERFGTFAAVRAYKLAAAGVFVAGLVAGLAALVALVSVVPSPPSVVTDVLGYVMPSDWAAQLSIIVAARAYSIVWYSWREGYKIAVS